MYASWRTRGTIPSAFRTCALPLLLVTPMAFVAPMASMHVCWPGSERELEQCHIGYLVLSSLLFVTPSAVIACVIAPASNLVY